MLSFKKYFPSLFICFLVFGCIGCNSDTKIYSSQQKAVCGIDFGHIEIPQFDNTSIGIAENEAPNPALIESNEPSEIPTSESEKPSVEPVYFDGDEMEILTQKVILGRDNPYRIISSDFSEHVKGVTDIDNYDYLFRTHEVYYTKEDFENCPDVILKLAKNEIYARHGRMFLDRDLYEYFLTRMWYEPIYAPEEFDDSCFNDCERANLELLLQLGA